MLVLDVLHPLEVADGDAAGVDQNVGQHRDAALEQRLVRRRRGRSVRCLGDHLGLHAGDIVGPDLILERSGNEDIAVDVQKIVVGDGRASGKTDHRSALLLVSERVFRIDALVRLHRRKERSRRLKVRPIPHGDGQGLLHREVLAHQRRLCDLPCSRNQRDGGVEVQRLRQRDRRLVKTIDRGEQVLAAAC